MDQKKPILYSPRKRKQSRVPLGEQAKRFYLEPYAKDGDENIQFFKCRICATEIKGNRIHNLAGHIAYAHKEKYAEIDPFLKEPLPMKQLQLLQNAVEIVSVNGRPFSFLSDSGYQAGIKNKIDKLNKAGHLIDLKRDIKTHLRQMAEKVRAKICEEVKGISLGMQLDVATVNGRSIQGVSLQYRKNGIMLVRSIGVIELEQSHTGIYLAKVCFDRIQQFGVNIKQIVTITRDNAANNNTLVDKMDNYLKSSIGQAKEQFDSPKRLEKPPVLDTEYSDNDIAELLAEPDEISDDQVLTDMFEAAIQERNTKLLNAMSNELNDIGFDIRWDITSVNCAAHTLQLGIHDALKLLPTKHQNLLELCRRAVKFLRLPKSEQDITAANIKYTKPRLEVVTRWGSMYLMVKIIHSFCSFFTVFSINSIQKHFLSFT